MSRDPYLDVKGDVESNLSALRDLVSQQGSSLKSPDPALVSELQSTIGLLEADIEDLEESVQAVEQVGDRWGISDTEKRTRRDFVERVKREVAGIRSKLSLGKTRGTSTGDGRYTDDPDDAERGGDEDAEEARRWEMEEQQTLVRRQDDTLGVISGTLHNLASQAGLIGTEVSVQTEMLDDLGNRVDNTDSRLNKVSKTMQDLIRRNEETKSEYCICILIIILIVLLVAVIIT